MICVSDTVALGHAFSATLPHAARIEPFIERWSVAGGSERANDQLLLAVLCGLLDVTRPDPAQKKPDL